MNNIVCPISADKIDSNVSRLTVFLNVVLMLLFLITLNPMFIGVVTADYFIRAALKVQYSPVRAISMPIIRMARLEKKAINLAPKIFASRLGLLCALTATVLLLLDYTIASICVTSGLMILSIMDSVFNFCVGCIIYNYLVYPFYKNK